MTPSSHRPTPFVALVAGVSLGLWLVVSAGVHTAVSHPIRIPQAPSSIVIEASDTAPMPSPGADPSIAQSLR